jgi:hypothetical protein
MSREIPKIIYEDLPEKFPHIARSIEIHEEELEKTAEAAGGFQYLEERLLRAAILRVHERILEERL